MKLAIERDDAEALAEKLEIGDEETVIIAAEVTVRREAGVHIGELITRGKLMAEAEVFVV